MADGGRITRNYSDEDRRAVAVQYTIHGCLARTAEATSIPDSTIHGWLQQEWFQSLLGSIRTEFSDRIHARTASLLEKSFDELEDRLDNGDAFVTKEGVIRVPMRGRDLAFTTAILFDKRQILMRQPTSITGRARGEEVAEELTAWLRSQKARVIEAAPATEEPR